ncbi:MAG: hypothetical protein ABMA00_19625 [Gemmatimonas sp.]
MTNESSPETSVAERLWAQATAQSRSAPEVTAAVERLFLQLRAGLLPWAGGEGYRALLDRAIGEVEAEHPLLAGLSFLGGDDAPLATRTDAQRALDADELQVVTVALVAALIAAFGRYVGSTLAVRLVDQIDFSCVSESVSIGPGGVRNVV